MITITRKIQMLFDVPEESVKECYKKIYDWQRIVMRAANHISTHSFIQESVKDLFYFEDQTKKKLANIEKDADGILNTSKGSTTYQILSKAFKGEAPMGMLAGLNQVVTKTFSKEAIDVKNGLKSLRSYRKNIPLPVRIGDVKNLTKNDNGNYTFTVYGIPFRLHFGKDLSGNEIIFDAMVRGEYKWCDSSMTINGNKIFLLAVFQFEKQEMQLLPENICEAELDINVPIKGIIGRKVFEIGGKEEFLYRRIAIQGALSRLQKALRYAKAGRGRAKKMKAIERYKLAENNYVDTRIHQYTAKLIDYCLKNKCGKLVLKNQQEKEKEAKADEQFLLRNWTYFGMKEKLEYKCKKYGIELEIL